MKRERDRRRPVRRHLCVVAALVAVGARWRGARRRRPAAPGAAKLGACPKHVRPQRLRCATLRVPFERADPLARADPDPLRRPPRATGEADRPAPIFAVEGGPGYGSIASARYYIHMLGPLLERRDLVVVDMRGTGHSRAIDCPKLQRGGGTDAPGRRPVRPHPRRPVRRLPDLGGGRRHRRRPPGARLPPDRAVRRLLRDLPRPVLRLPPRRRAAGARPRQRLSRPRREPALPEPVADRDPAPCDRLRRARCHGNAARRLRRIRRAAAANAARRRAAARRDRLGGYESPRHNYLRIDSAISAYLAGDRRPYRRLTEAGRRLRKYRFYSRGDELAVSCNDYPMLWDKRAGRRSARRQLHAEVRGYRQREFAPVHPGRGGARAPPPATWSAWRGRSRASSTSRRRRRTRRGRRCRRW